MPPILGQILKLLVKSNNFWEPIYKVKRREEKVVGQVGGGLSEQMTNEDIFHWDLIDF